MPARWTMAFEDDVHVGDLTSRSMIGENTLIFRIMFGSHFGHSFIGTYVWTFDEISDLR
jgi:hypothetical protein